MGDISDLRIEETYLDTHVADIGPQNVLIVDDEPRIGAAYGKLLAGPNRVIETASSGGAALSKLESGDVDVLVLDLHLPDMTGMDVMDWLGRSSISTAVVIFSADESIDSAIFSLRKGAFEFIRKSADPDDLIEAVGRALLRRRIERSHALMMARLEQSERLHRFLVEQSPDIIYTLDHQGRFIFVNRRLETLLGFGRDELIGKHYSNIVWDEDREQARFIFNERREGERATSNAEIRLKCKDAGFRHFDNRLVVTMLSSMGVWSKQEESAAGRFIGTYGVARDITERKRAEETINFQAFHDLLTGLPNRVLFQDRLQIAIEQSRRSGKSLAVMFIDLDRFKLVNDTYGHAAGDDLLKGFTERVRGCLRAADTLARQGGDEFIALLPDLSTPADAERIAAKMLASLDDQFTIDGRDFRATASVGISVFPEDGDSAETLIRNADIAMYQVKARGKNGCLRYRAEMSASHQRRVSFENDLRQALAQQQFELHYQPQVSLTEKRMIGVEALIRWRHPIHGLLNPGSFISIAEESGLIVSMSDWALREALRQWMAWRAAGLPAFRVSVNLSPQEFDYGDLVSRVIAALEASGAPPSALELEITETMLMHDVDKVTAQVRELRGHGIRVAIDDFGTRYSSLNYLRRFSISTIKIDQSFIRDLDGDHGSLSIVRAILGIAHGFGLHVLAEGVENDIQVDALLGLGCADMQGFLFARPVPGAEIAGFIAELDSKIDRLAPRQAH